MKKIILTITLIGALFYTNFAQNNIGINTDTPDSSAILDIVSEDKGLLIPRMTTSQRDSISQPANGLMVFDVELDAFSYYSDSLNSWIVLPKKSEIYWIKIGDNICNINTQNVGIGILNPNNNLHIKGKPNEKSGLTITNGDSTYNIIIVIDPTDDGIIFTGDDGNTIKNLFGADKSGRFGIGISNPASLLHLKPQPGVEPKIQISNEDSTYNIIIVIDPTDDGIIVKGDDGNTLRDLYTADKIGRFGVGLNKPRNVLHLKSDTLNPNIRLTREGGDFDYVMGFDSLSTDFIIKRMSNLDGSSEDVFVQVTPDGDVNFFSENNITISPGVSTNEVNTEDLTTNQIEFNNPYGGPNPLITVSPDGYLDFGQTLGSKNGILSLRFQLGAINNSNQVIDLNVDQNILPNTPSAYSFTIGSSLITINEKGYYAVSYNIATQDSNNASNPIYTTITSGLYTPTNAIFQNTEYKNFLRTDQTNENSFSHTQILYFNAGDQFKLRLSRSNNPSVIEILQKSNISIHKIAN